MEFYELAEALRAMKVETGSLVCLGCRYENNCGIKGCAILVQAASAIDILPKTVCSLTNVQEFYKLAESALRQKDVADKDVWKWISVKDRMPEPGVNVLARCFYHECWQMFVCHVSKRNPGNWYTGIAGQWAQVTHWMPLPDPPEEDDHG